MVFDVMSSLRDAGITIVIFEHKLELLREHADVVHVLADHRIVSTGTPRSVLGDERLDEWGVGNTRFTDAAAAAVKRGLLPVETDLPVSLTDAVDVFGAAR
jgi:energy-coupling factor transporter ATP-binding protein EcfA2